MVAALLLMTGGAFADGGRWSQVTEPYLVIQKALASDQMTGVADAARAIVRDAADAASSKDKADRNTAAAMKGAAEKLTAASDIKAMRERFKELSVPYAAWVKAGHGGKDLDVYFCPMARARWVQKKGEEMTNPYYGKEMSGCGEKV